jgi:conjugal transfer pilus assembly protein TraV
MKSLFFVLAAAGLLSACSSAPRTPDYECALDDVKSAKCASMEDAYRAARNMNRGEHARVQSVFDGRIQGDARAAAGAPMFSGQPSNFPEPGNAGAPVFQQPKVMRVWVAPYVDGDGNLRSGEYTYFSTPGSWNYGSLNKPGAAAGIFEPAKASNLGFQPVEKSSAKATASGRPSAPPEAQAAAKSAQAQNSGVAGPATPAATDSSGTITQPYQRLSN